MPRPLPRNSVADVLREQLAASNKRETELLRQLAEKDEQIRLVLDEKFFRPVVTGRQAMPENKFPQQLEEDVVHFPTEGDEKEIAAQAEREREARETLDAELAAIAEEHHKFHENHPELITTEIPAEVLPA